MNFKARGFKQLDAKLGRMAKSFNRRKERDILTVAAEDLLSEMKALVPVLTGELRDSLAIVEGDAQIYVGPTRPGGRHAHYNEFGTVNMTAQPFIRPAYDNSEAALVDAIGLGVIDEINEARRG